MKLAIQQISQIEDVRYTLAYGMTGKWENPEASLDACIEVLKEVKKSLKSPEGSTNK